MEINYDAESDSAYIKIGHGKFNKCYEHNDNVLLDLDEGDAIIGIEVSGAKKYILKGSQIDILRIVEEEGLKNLPTWINSKLIQG